MKNNKLNNTYQLLMALVLLCSSFAVGIFAQEPGSAPKLPPGMKGSNANDPRAKLKPGLFDAGETALGMKHLALLKNRMLFNSALIILMIRKCSKLSDCLESAILPSCLKPSNWFSPNLPLLIPILRFRAITYFRVISTVSTFMIFPARLRPNY